MVWCWRTGGSGCSVAAAGEITSIYATQLGTIALTWRRSTFGILFTDVHLMPASSPTVDKENAVTDIFRLHVHPFLPWTRKGSKRREFTCIGGRRRVVDIAWDLSLATFSRDRGPEPCAGSFISIAVDGEVALVIGNNEEEACLRKGNGGEGLGMISQMERVRFGENGGVLSYATKARFGGKEMMVSISIDLQEEEMVLKIDGDRVLEVGRLRWKFRGSSYVVARSSGRVQVSWDIHDWFFQRNGRWVRSPVIGRTCGNAVFVFLFERCRQGEGEIGKELNSREAFSEGEHGCCLKRNEWNECSTASASTSASEASAMEELEYYEEAEPPNADDRGFTLLVSGWKC